MKPGDEKRLPSGGQTTEHGGPFRLGAIMIVIGIVGLATVAIRPVHSSYEPPEGSPIQIGPFQLKLTNSQIGNWFGVLTVCTGLLEISNKRWRKRPVVLFLGFLSTASVFFSLALLFSSLKGMSSSPDLARTPVDGPSDLIPDNSLPYGTTGSTITHRDNDHRVRIILLLYPLMKTGSQENIDARMKKTTSGYDWTQLRNFRNAVTTAQEPTERNSTDQRLDDTTTSKTDLISISETTSSRTGTSSSDVGSAYEEGYDINDDDDDDDDNDDDGSGRKNEFGKEMNEGDYDPYDDETKSETSSINDYFDEFQYRHGERKKRNADKVLENYKVPEVRMNLMINCILASAGLLNVILSLITAFLAFSQFSCPPDKKMDSESNVPTVYISKQTPAAIDDDVPLFQRKE